MGSSYANASAKVRTASGKYYIMLIPGGQTTGPEYEALYTYGGGWKQRYLIKIDSSFYMAPVQWNSKGYKDNSSGKWVNYNPNKWFNADGSLINIATNKFRTYSYDKNCVNCHVTGGKIDRSITGVDTFWVSYWGKNKSVGEMNISCESCHGPGSVHASTADKSKIINPAKMTSNLRK